MNYIDTCREFIISRLPMLCGKEVFMQDIGILVTENNPWNCLNRDIAKTQLEAWRKEAATLHDFWIETLGCIPYNPFSEPEKYLSEMISEGVNQILYSCPMVREFENYTLTMNKNLIEDILNYVRNVKYIEFI